MKNNVTSLMLLSFVLLIVLSAMAEPKAKVDHGGRALKGDAIRTEPYRDAKMVGNLEKGDKVQIVNRDGGWYKVKSARGNGWVRMLSIRRSAVTKTKYSSKGILGLATGRKGKGKIVLTTGIRGLNEENLKTARFNAEQLSILESYGVSKVQALRFAIMGKLKAREIAYLKGEGAK